jgi:hypothetical protein
VKNFLFCAKVALGHFGTNWSIFHRTSAKSYRRIKVSPVSLWALHFFRLGKLFAALLPKERRLGLFSFGADAELDLVNCALAKDPS